MADKLNSKNKCNHCYYCQCLTGRFLYLWLINSAQVDLVCVSIGGDIGARQKNPLGPRHARKGVG